MEGDALAAFFGRSLDIRLRDMGALLGIFSLIAAGDPTLWRGTTMGGAMIAVVAITAWSRWQFGSRGVTTRLIAGNLIVLLGCHLAIITSTGGLRSPFLPIFLPVVLFASTLLGRNRIVVAVVTIQLTGLVALLGAEWAGADLRYAPMGDVLPTHGGWLVALTMMILVVLCAVGGTVIRTHFLRLSDMVATLQDEAVAVHREQANELAALSAELAHEVKNPLASIKGLAALLSRDVTEGKPAERLGVLRQEIDRMATTVDELLALNRPLSPLRTEAIDLREEVAQIVALHEGIAARQDKRVVHLEGPEVRASVDTRKLKKMLVNLIQNALDAAPRGSSVTVEISTTDPWVDVAVTDGGPGLPEAMAARVFDTGVTTKAEGSGLGLPISRALARQHGGDITLDNQDEGGCRAVIRLPLHQGAAP